MMNWLGLMMRARDIARVARSNESKPFSNSSYYPANDNPKLPSQDFIISAVNVFIEAGNNDEATLTRIKHHLREVNLPSEKIDFVADMAQKVYEVLQSRPGRNNIEVNAELANNLSISEPIIFCLKPRELYANFFRALIGKDSYRMKSTKEVIYVMATYA